MVNIFWGGFIEKGIKGKKYQCDLCEVNKGKSNVQCILCMGILRCTDKQCMRGCGITNVASVIITLRSVGWHTQNEMIG